VRGERCCLVEDQNRSPQITHISWGRLEVKGKAEPYKDAKFFPGGSREWNWRETGTEHVPGIQPADVQELLDHGAKVVVLSQGMAECLRVPGETLDFLKGGASKRISCRRLRRRSSTTGLQKKSQSGGCFTRPAEIRGDAEAGGRPAWLFGFDWEFLKLPFHPPATVYISLSPAAANNPVGTPSVWVSKTDT
jgi:hypothetical protein